MTNDTSETRVFALIDRNGRDLRDMAAFLEGQIVALGKVVRASSGKSVRVIEASPLFRPGQRAIDSPYLRVDVLGPKGEVVESTVGPIIPNLQNETEWRASREAADDTARADGIADWLDIPRLSERSLDEAFEKGRLPIDMLEGLGVAGEVAATSRLQVVGWTAAEVKKVYEYLRAAK